MYIYRDENLEIIKSEANDCRPVVVTPGWKIQVLNYHEAIDIRSFTYMERHFYSNETFVLMLGEAYFIGGDDCSTPNNIKVFRMENGVLYNTKRNVWHFIVADSECSIVVVENEDTTWNNSEKYFIDDVLKTSVINKVYDLKVKAENDRKEKRCNEK